MLEFFLGIYFISTNKRCSCFRKKTLTWTFSRCFFFEIFMRKISVFSSYKSFDWEKTFYWMKIKWIFPFIYSRLIRDKQTKMVWLLINNYFHFLIARCLTSGKIFSVHYSLSISMDGRSWCHFISLVLKIDKQTDQIISH
jgi:hypothetical protein